MDSNQPHPIAARAERTQTDSHGALLEFQKSQIYKNLIVFTERLKNTSPVLIGLEELSK